MIAYCAECGVKVAEIKKGSTIKSGTIFTCLECQDKKKLPDFMSDFLKGFSK